MLAYTSTTRGTPGVLATWVHSKLPLRRGGVGSTGTPITPVPRGRGVQRKKTDATAAAMEESNAGTAGRGPGRRAVSVSLSALWLVPSPAYATDLATYVVGAKDRDSVRLTTREPFYPTP